MAASGGHWVKSLVPGGNEYTFIPKTEVHQGTVSVITNKGTGVLWDSQGGLSVVQIATGFSVVHTASGNVIATSDNEDAAKAMATSLNATGMDWKGSADKLIAQYEANPEMKNAVGLIKNTYKNMPEEIAKTHDAAYIQAYQKQKAQEFETFAPAPKTVAPSPTQVAKIEGAIPQKGAGINAPASHESFMAQAKEVPITTIMGKKQTATGVVMPDGKTAVTYNANTGNYHVVDMATGKTIETTKSLETAYSNAKSQALQYVDIPAPAPKVPYHEFKSSSEADSMIQKASANQPPVDSASHNALYGYQDGEYGSINGYLWSNGKSYSSGNVLTKVKSIDAAMKTHAAPFDMVVTRSKEKGSALYHFAKAAEVGGKYQSLGYDSTSTAPGWSWGGAGVRLIYRMPKGTPGVYFNSLKGYSSSHPSEHEWLMGRNLSWNIVGKQSSPGGSITLTLEFDGVFTP